jgi:hypothetical protein
MFGRTEFAGEGSNHEHVTARFSSPSVHPLFEIAAFSFCTLLAWFSDRSSLSPHPNPSECIPTSCSHTRMQSQRSHSPPHPSHPASMHFTLGFMHIDTLSFSHGSYDTTNPFRILLFATYLDLQSLYDEIQVRIVQEMCHGLFHDFLEFSEYENLTGGKWGTPVNHCFSGAAARRKCKYCCRRIR